MRGVDLRHRRWSADDFLFAVLKSTSRKPWDQCFPDARAWLDQHLEPCWWRLAGDLIAYHGNQTDDATRTALIQRDATSSGQSEGMSLGRRDQLHVASLQLSHESTKLPALNFVGRVEHLEADWARALELWLPLREVAEQVDNKKNGARTPSHIHQLASVALGNVGNPSAASLVKSANDTLSPCQGVFDRSHGCAAYLEATRGSQLSPSAVCALCCSWQYGQDMRRYGYGDGCAGGCAIASPRITNT